MLSHLSYRELGAFMRAWHQYDPDEEYEGDMNQILHDIVAAPNEFSPDQDEWLAHWPEDVQEEALVALLIEELVLRGGGQDSVEPWPPTTLAEHLLRSMGW